MVTAIIVLVSVMAFTAICMMFLAMMEFAVYMRAMRKSPETVVVAAPAAVPAPTPVPEKEAEAEAEPEKEAEPEAREETPADENSVTFEVGQAQRQTLKEAYDSLEKVYREFYDRILAAVNELQMARVIESTYAVTVMQGRDNIGRLRILRGTVTLDCTVINPDLVKYNKENGKQITYFVVETLPDGTKYVKMGNIYPSNDENAEGIVYEDVEVTLGDAPGSVVTKGTVYEDRLAEALDSDAKTALIALGFKFIEAAPAVTRP
jgi:hypothetical protein